MYQSPAIWYPQNTMLDASLSIWKPRLNSCILTWSESKYLKVLATAYWYAIWITNHQMIRHSHNLNTVLVQYSYCDCSTLIKYLAEQNINFESPKFFKLFFKLENWIFVSNIEYATHIQFITNFWPKVRPKEKKCVKICPYNRTGPYKRTQIAALLFYCGGAAVDERRGTHLKLK